jgi:hypothetical protein
MKCKCSIVLVFFLFLAPSLSIAEDLILRDSVGPTSKFTEELPGFSNYSTEGEGTVIAAQFEVKQEVDLSEIILIGYSSSAAPPLFENFEFRLEVFSSPENVYGFNPDIFVGIISLVSAEEHGTAAGGLASYRLAFDVADQQILLEQGSYYLAVYFETEDSEISGDWFVSYSFFGPEYPDIHLEFSTLGFQPPAAFKIKGTLPAPGIPGDLNGDGVVNVSDLLILLGAWGPCPSGGEPCPADLNGDGSVNVSDLLILLGNWG